MCSAANEDLSIVHSAFQVSAGIAKYGIHLGQHQFNRFFAQNGSIRELAKELVQANTVMQMMVVTDSHPMPSGHGESSRRRPASRTLISGDKSIVRADMFQAKVLCADCELANVRGKFCARIRACMHTYMHA